MKFFNNIISRMNPFLLVIVFISGLWSTAEIKGSGVSFPLAKRSKLKYCKVDVFLDCYFEPLFQFSHTPTGTGFPLNETEYEQWCL